MMCERCEEWVVTCKFRTDNSTTIAEFYRGSYDECVHILEHFAPGSNDRERTYHWTPSMGTVTAWQEFLRDNASQPGVETLYVSGGA